jgi:uncharacterized membrane protein
MITALASIGDLTQAFDGTIFATGTAGTNLNSLVSVIIAIMTVGAGIWFLFLLVSGGIGIMSAGGNKQALSDAQKKITMGFVGLVVVVAALLIASLIGTIFQIEILDPGSVIDAL